MTVEPGFGGQKFNPEAAKKCSVLRQRFPALQIQVTRALPAEQALASIGGCTLNNQPHQGNLEHSPHFPLAFILCSCLDV